MTKTKPHNREKALDQAVSVFWEQGFHATSLKDLEAALGMHPGSIYGAFQSKENLFRLAINRYADQLGAQRDAVVASASSPLQGLAAFIREVHPVMRDDTPSRACMLTRSALEPTEPGSPVRADLDALMETTEAGIRKIFTAAQENGDLPEGADPGFLARKLHVSLMGLGVLAQRTGGTEDARAMAEQIAQEIEALDASRQA